MASDNTLVIKINGSAKDFLDELDKVQKKTKDTEKVLKATAKASAIAFAGFAASIAAVTNQFIDYEKALVGVGKTTDIEGKKLENFGKQFQKLSQEIPVSTNELLGIAQAAGQLGISGEKNILKFTKVMAQLGVATDLSGEQAATSIARLLGITGESVETVDKLGSVLVALGNTSKATESEILAMALSVGKSTSVFGLSSGEAASFGTVLKELGQEAQLSGSVVGKSLLKIQKAIDGGGDKLAKLSQLTGIAGSDLKKTFQDDASGVFRSFLAGLGNLEGGTTAMFAALESFGLKGDEVNKVLPVLAKNTDALNKAFATTNRELLNANALTKESEKAFATLGAEKEKLFNTVQNLAVEIGAELAPTIKAIVVDAREFVSAIRENSSAISENIAFVLKWGAIITGFIASAAAFGLAVIKVSAIITALGAAFLPATIAASSFWIALTGPVGLAVAGIAAVTAGIVALTKAASKKEEPETLSEINKQLDDLKKKQDALRNSPGFSFRNQRALDSIKKEIKELEKLREAKARATEDFGTGSLLVRPEADAGGLNLGASAFGIEEQTIPFAPAAEEGVDKVAEKTKKTAKETTAVLSAEQQKRLNNLKVSNAELLAIQKARGTASTEEEKDIAEKKAAIEAQRVEARKIKNKELRDAELTNIKLTNEDALAEIAEFEANKEQREADARERKIVLDQQLAELSAEQRALIDEEERAVLEEKIATREEIKIAEAQRELERKRIEREQFLVDEAKYGENIAKTKAFFRKEEIQGTKQASAQLIQLTNSKNSTLKGIGKAAASVNAAIATGEGAIKAYTALAGIPIVGPGLGAAAAGALIAFGVEQQQNILAANTGGMVPLSMGTRGKDSVPATLTPGELVVPDKNFDEVVEATANSRGFSSDEESSGLITVAIEPKGDLIDLIEQQIVERRVQGTGIL